MSGRPAWLELLAKTESEVHEKLAVIETMEPNIKSLIYSQMDDTLENLLYLTENADSPIEQIMALALDKRMRETGLNYHIEPQSAIQAKGKQYRVDLLLEIHRGDSSIDYAIECDGHEFHEKTKEQARRDKARERALQGQGITVIRFTGSEIWDNPWRCAEEVVRIFLKNL